MTSPLGGVRSIQLSYGRKGANYAKSGFYRQWFTERKIKKPLTIK